MRTLALVCLLFFVAGPVWCQDEEIVASDGPRAEFEKLSKSYDEQMQAFWAGFQELKTDEERQKYYEAKYPKPDAIALKMMALAKANAGKPVGFDAIFWAVNNRVQGEAKKAALDMLGSHYLDEPRLGKMMGSLAMDPSKATGTFLESAMTKSTNREVKGAAHFHYAKHLLNRVTMANYLKGMKGDELKSFVTYFGPEAVAELEKVDAATTGAEAEKLLDTVVAEYADLDSGRRGQTMGEVAKRDLFELRNLSIGKVAPEIKGEDIDGKVFALTEYRGKVIFLDFWGDW